MSYDDYLLTQGEAFRTRATIFMSAQVDQDWYPVKALGDGTCFWRALSQGIVYGNKSTDDVYRLSLDPFQYQVKKQNGSYDDYLKQLPYDPDGLYGTLFRRARRIFRLNLYATRKRDDEVMRIFDLHYSLKKSPLDKHFGPGKAYGIFRTGSIMFDKDDKELSYEVQRVQPSAVIGRFWSMFKDEYGWQDDDGSWKSFNDDALCTQLAHWRKNNSPNDDLTVYDANVDVSDGILQVVVAENVSNGRTDDDFSISWAGQSELAIASHLPCVRSIRCWNIQFGRWEQWDGSGDALFNPTVYGDGVDVCLLYNGAHYDTLIHSNRIGDYLSTVHQKKTTSKKKKTSKKKSTPGPRFIQYGQPPPGTKEN